MALITPFGQYVGGDSIVHRLDARLKLLLLATFLTGLFLVQSAWGMLLFVALLISTYLVAKVPLSLALRGLKPLFIILAFTLLVNSFSFSLTAGVPPSWEGVALIGGFGIKPEGVLRGVFLTVRIIALFSASSLLTYTSSLVALSDALVQLLKPLARIKVPTEDIAMMFSIALRFIPITTAEAERIMLAQSARGAKFSEGSVLTRVKAWIPVLVPLFVRLFKRADTLAAAMESRCYSGQQRTHLSNKRLKILQIVLVMIVSAALVTAGILL